MSDNPKLKKNGGNGTFLGNVLRTLKDVSPQLISIIGSSIPGVGGLTSIISGITGDKKTPPRYEPNLRAKSWKIGIRRLVNSRMTTLKLEKCIEKWAYR